MLDFIYCGETQLDKEDIESFVKLSVEIEVFGLTTDVIEEKKLQKKEILQILEPRILQKQSKLSI